MYEKRNRLVLENVRLVNYFVIKFGVNYKSPDYEDLVSIGTIGLIKAAESFDESKGIKFATYASRCIQNEILMHFRKSNVYANDISLESSIMNDKEGNEIKLSDTISADESDFVEQIENRDVFEKYMNIILNLLAPRDRLIMLYRIGNVGQDRISEKINISQSYISRLERKLNMKVKSYMNVQKQFKEVFSMKVLDNSYKISFSSKDVKQFNKIFATLLTTIKTPSILPEFKVSCNKERVIIQIPAYQEAFSFIAEVMRQIDDFSMAFVSEKDIQTIDTTANSVVSNAEDEDIESENIYEAIEPNIEDEAAVESEDTDELAKSNIEQNASTANSEDARLIEQNDLNVEKGSKVKKVRDYILSLESFTTKELRQQFPDLNNSKDSTINNALYLAKSRGLIRSVSKGKYIVNRN